MSAPKKGKPKETAAARKLRLAHELVKQAREAEQASWRAKCEAQLKDPIYQAQQAARRENSEARERTRLINKENKALAKIAALHDCPRYHDIEFTAYHEAGHAVVYEVLDSGVSLATIIPTKKDESGRSNNAASGFDSLGHVRPNGPLPLPRRQQVLVTVACCLAGGYAAEVAGDEEWDWGTGGDHKIIKTAMESLGYQPDSREYHQLLEEAGAVCDSLFEDPKVWQAIEDVKELLMSEKTISGGDVRAVVKMHQFPGLLKIDITKQLCFHYRKNRPEVGYGESPSFQLGIGVTTGTSGYWYRGYELSNPAYVEKVKTDNAQPKLRWVKQAIQQHFAFSKGAA